MQNQNDLKAAINEARQKMERCQEGLKEYKEAEEFAEKCDQKIEIYEEERAQVRAE